MNIDSLTLSSWHLVNDYSCVFECKTFRDGSFQCWQWRNCNIHLLNGKLFNKIKSVITCIDQLFVLHQSHTMTRVALRNFHMFQFVYSWWLQPIFRSSKYFRRKGIGFDGFLEFIFFLRKLNIYFENSLFIELRKFNCERCNSGKSTGIVNNICCWCSIVEFEEHKVRNKS